jgi:hypothetical protein
MLTFGPWTGYLACLVCVLVIYKVADGHLSACFTVSAAFQLLSLSFKVICTSLHDGPLNALGISKSAVLLETWALGCRLMSTLQGEGYLPVDSSGDFLCQALDVCSLLLAVCLFSRFYALQRRARALTPHTEIAVTPAVMTAFMLAALFHGQGNLLPFIDVAWMAGFILGAFALVPQFLHFASGKLMNRWILHSLIATSCAWATSGVVLVYEYGIDVIGPSSAFSWGIVVVYMAVLALHVEFSFQYCIPSWPARGLLASCVYLMRLGEATRSQPWKLNRGLRSCCIISGCLVALVTLYSSIMMKIDDIEGENGSFSSIMIKIMMLLANVVFYTKGHGRSTFPRCVQDTFAKFCLCVGTLAETAATGKKLRASSCASKAFVGTCHKSGKHRKVASRPAPALLEPLPIESRRQSFAVAQQELIDGDSCSGLEKLQIETDGVGSSRMSTHSPSGSDFEEEDRCANEPSIQAPILLNAAPRGAQWFTDGERSFEPLVSPTGQLFYTDGVQVFMLACVSVESDRDADHPYSALLKRQKVTW